MADTTGPSKDHAVPRWVKVSMVIAGILALLVLAALIFGGGQHGPSRHGPSSHQHPGEVGTPSAVDGYGRSRGADGATLHGWSAGIGDAPHPSQRPAAAAAEPRNERTAEGSPSW